MFRIFNEKKKHHQLFLYGSAVNFQNPLLFNSTQNNKLNALVIITMSPLFSLYLPPAFWAIDMAFSLATIWNSWKRCEMRWFIFKYFSMQFKAHVSCNETTNHRIALAKCIDMILALKMTEKVKNHRIYLVSLHISRCEIGDTIAEANFRQFVVWLQEIGELNQRKMMKISTNKLRLGFELIFFSQKRIHHIRWEIFCTTYSFQLIFIKWFERNTSHRCFFVCFYSRNMMLQWVTLISRGSEQLNSSNVDIQ